MISGISFVATATNFVCRQADPEGWYRLLPSRKCPCFNGQCLTEKCTIQNNFGRSCICFGKNTIPYPGRYVIYTKGRLFLLKQKGSVKRRRCYCYCKPPTPGSRLCWRLVTTLAI